MTIPQLLAKVFRHDFIVYCDDGKTALKRTKPNAELPPDLMDLLKSRKAELVDWFTNRAEDETCARCQASVYLTKTVTRSDVARVCRADGGRSDCPYEAKR